MIDTEIIDLKLEIARYSSGVIKCLQEELDREPTMKGKYEITSKYIKLFEGTPIEEVLSSILIEMQTNHLLL